MKQIIITCGIPGAGKSFWVNKNVPEPRTYINADSIRKELYGSEEEQGDPKEVFGKVFDRFENALEDPTVETIVVDNTSVSYKRRKDFYKLIEKKNLDCKIKLVVFPNHDLARKRNNARPRKVPEFVLNRMISNFQMPMFEEEKMKNMEVVYIKE